MSFFAKAFRGIIPHPSPSAPAGYRAYAVGDVHGRLDLLNDLLAKIEADIASRQEAKCVVVFLGDLIDRGPHSSQVIERVRTWQPEQAETIFLCGNHEEILLRLIAGERKLLPNWLKYGGLECLESYGLCATDLSGMNEEQAIDLMRGAIPVEHQQFISMFADTLRFGDYLFVHAGIRPGRKISEQVPHDLRWIRHPFLEDLTDHGFTVVHGHTITPEVDQRANRIGVDTGAYRTGVLTAIALERTKRWFLDTSIPSPN